MNLLNKKTMFGLTLFGATMFGLSSCVNENESIKVEDRWGVPEDSKADPNPPIDIPNIVIPNVVFTATGNKSQIEINLTGVQDPESKEWIRLYGNNILSGKQNVWVEIDGVPKGILVTNKIDDISKKVTVDLIFSIDNSDSMNEEANVVAENILDWATKLTQQNIDIRFGCISYGIRYYDSAAGGINLTNLEGINNFLNRPGRNGINRTDGFEGPDADRLIAASKDYTKAKDECGAEAIRFANEYYSFRSGANRIYVNFTDEPNQPNGHPDISTEYFADQNSWNTAQGTIHTVYSESPNFNHSVNYNEHPWKMSEYTGGTVLYTNPYFNGITLDSLPITEAMNNSYIITFIDDSPISDGDHDVKITILAEDGKLKAERVFKNVSFSN